MVEMAELADGRGLLTDYVRRGSESAFRELVSRYADLVYSVALRWVGENRHLAEDITQTVFADLARLAGRVPAEAPLGGWLHRHTCYVAAKVMRGERRRQFRERRAADMNATEDHTEENLAQITPVLDDAINHLPAPERLAIVLRYFERRDLQSIGRVLGGSEDAAQKRVARALEKLRVLLAHRGVARSGAALTAVLTTQAVTAAPAGLAASAASSAMLSAVVGGGVGWGIFSFMAMTKLKLAVGALVATGVGVTLVLEHQIQEQFREENASLRAQLEQRAEAPPPAVAPSSNTSGLTEEQHRELLRLRGEIGLLRNQQQEQQKEFNRLRAAAKTRPASTPQPVVQDYYPRQALAFAGYAEPEATFQTSVWGLTRGDVQAALAAYSPELRERLESQLFQGRSDAEIAAQMSREMEGVTGFRILSKEKVSEDEVWMTVLSEGRNHTKTIVLKRYDNEWKLAGDRPNPPPENR